jgi:hypothetical protein
MEATVLEYHIFFDSLGPALPSPPGSHIARCRAALAALSARIAPRLGRAGWHCEPFSLSLWDPADVATRCNHGWVSADTSATANLGHFITEPHLWGRVNVGESLDDEWFAVGLLLQVSVEQRDASVTVTNGDGELLLIEAAYAIPSWFTPECASNSVFLRCGHVHIVPLDSTTNGDAPLLLADGLRALRTGKHGRTVHAAVTWVVRARTEPLIGTDNVAHCPPRHGARCILPTRVASLLLVEPSLAAAATTAFAERGNGAIAGPFPHCALLPRGTVEAHVELGWYAYAKLMSARHPPDDGGFAMPLPSHPRHKETVGARIALGMELLLQYGRSHAGSSSISGGLGVGGASGDCSATGQEADGAGWESFDAELHSRGNYRGELPSSLLYARVRKEATAAYAAIVDGVRCPSPPGRTGWMTGMAQLARSLLIGDARSRLEAMALPAAEDLPVEESNSWFGVDAEQFEEEVRRRAAPTDKRTPTGQQCESKFGAVAAAAAVHAQAEAMQLRRVVSSVSVFVSGMSSPGGADLLVCVGQAVSLDTSRFLTALSGALGESDPEVSERRTRKGANEEHVNEAEAPDGFDGDMERDVESEEGEGSSEEEEEEEEESRKGLTELIAAMDRELRHSDLRTPPRENTNLRPVHLDLNLVKNLLDTHMYSAQQGVADPASNLLGGVAFCLDMR